MGTFLHDLNFLYVPKLMPQKEHNKIIKKDLNKSKPK